MSLTGANNAEAASPSCVPAPPTTGVDLQRSLEDAKERVKQHNASMKEMLRRSDADMAAAKSKRRRLSCSISILSRDIRALSGGLSGTIFEEDSRLETQIAEKQRRRRELQQQKDMCSQTMNATEDAVHLLKMRQALVAKQMKRLGAHIARIEKDDRALGEKHAYILQTEAETNSARQVVEEKREYIRRAQLEIMAAQQGLKEKQGYLRQTEVDTQVALGVVEAKSEYIHQTEISTTMARQILEEKQEYIRQREGDAAQAQRDCERKRDHLDQTSRSARSQLDILDQQLTRWAALPALDTRV